jgi:RimK family alpha-L-glutamate ligase
MRIGILAADDSWYYRDLMRAAQNKCEVEQLSFANLQAAVGGDVGFSCSAGHSNLHDFQAILIRTMPPGSLEQVVFRMDLLGQLAEQDIAVLNPPRAIEMAVDKYLTTAKLAQANLPTPRTIVCQTAAQAMQAFIDLGGDVVLKPLFGSEGRGITRLSDEALAVRAFRALEQLGAVLYLQEYVLHEGFDCRVLVIGDDSFAMKRVNPNDWRTNVSRGATAYPFAASPEIIDLARRAAAAVQTPIAGVDLLLDRQGKWQVIEVNAVPGWKALAATLNVDIAERVIEYTMQRVVRQQGSRA